MTNRNAKVLAYRYIYSWASLIAMNRDEDRLIEMSDDKNEREMIRLECEKIARILHKHVNPSHDEIRATDKWYLR